jgi:Fic family protein
LVHLQQQMRNELLSERRPTSVVRLAEHLFSTPVVSSNTVINLLGVSGPTAQAVIRTLVERGDLIEVTGRERDRIYRAPKVFDAVYGPVEVPGV